MKRFITIIFLALTIFGVNAKAQSKSTPELRQKTFEKAWQIVNDKFWDSTFGGVDWNAVRTRYAPQVAATKTDGEFDELMNKMLGELKTSHMGIISRDEIASYGKVPAITGIGFREIDGKMVITHILDKSSAAEAGLRPGLVIIKADGQTVGNFNDAQEKLSGDANTTVRVGYLDGDDSEHEVTLERRPLGANDKSKLSGISFYGIFDSKRLDGNIGYIYFSNFLEFLNPKIKSAIESMHDAPGIIIDIRGNSGGDDSVGVKMASLFFDKETQLMITKTRKGEEFDYKAKGLRDAYKGKVVILLDEHSMSASEEFSAGMQASGRAAVIGQPTPGSDMDGELESLPDGSVLLYAHGQTRTTKGYVVEGHGVKPNFEVKHTRKDLLAGRDSQLAAAIEYIKKNAK